MARVLVIRQHYFPLDIRVRREVEALRSAGHEVDVICVARSGERWRERWDGVRIVRIPFDLRHGGSVSYILKYGVFAVVAGMLAAALHLRRRYGLVQVNSLPDTLVFSALVPRLLGARVLLDLHETMPEFFATRFRTSADASGVRLVAAAEQVSIRFATHVITCTQEMKEAFVSRGAAPGKIDVVLNSADESIFDVERYPPQPRQDGRFVLMVHGSVEERYGIDTTIHALALLADEIPGLELHVYGRGAQLPQLERLAEDLGVSDRVTFQREWLPIDQVVDALSRADAGVVAMKRDAFRDLTHCNKMYELVTMRRPAIVSRTRSVEAYFDEGSFAWFESNDPHDLAYAIRRLYDNPEWARALVEHAAARNEPYRWAHQRDHYLDVVRRTLI
jgi:glycosyltransferase involved in cell wall biosynthesis